MSPSSFLAYSSLFLRPLTLAFLGVLFVFLSSAALILWSLWAKPQFFEYRTSFPNLPFVYLVLLGPIFAIANAFAEEFIFRGIMFSALQKSFKNTTAVILIQAASFGLLHMNGFPRGWVGVGLAGIYGLFLGLLRHMSQGMLVPIIIHIFADVTIVAILLISMFKSV